MRKVMTTLAACALCTLPGFAAAADDAKPPSTAKTAAGADSTSKAAEDAKKNPVAEQSVTKHAFAAGGTKFAYTATAGTLIVDDDSGKPIASLGYVAYERDGIADASRRPLVFAFNGGPGSSSLWLHMGVLGPKRVAVADGVAAPPAPYPIVDNAYGVLDVADLVLIDPVGTGISKAVGDKKDEDFWGVDADIDSVGRFVAQYVSDRGRWNSPKYLMGESYGTTRAAGVAHWLQSRRAMALNGLVLVSVATDMEAIDAYAPGNDRPYPLYLPAYALAAQKHGVLPGPGRPRDALIAEVKQFAYGPYLAALIKGDALTDGERDAIAAKLNEYTGLSPEYWKAANLRATEGMFTHELLKASRRTVGRLDTRYTGVTLDVLVKEAEYDPQLSGIVAGYTAAFNDWWRNGLRFGAGKQYLATNFEIGNQWKWTHKVDGGVQPYVNTGVDLARAMVENPGLRVLVLNGYYDLATPFSATEYMIDHLGLPPGFRDHLTMKYYDAGHMMYVNPASLGQMKQDIDAFIAATHR